MRVPCRVMGTTQPGKYTARPPAHLRFTHRNFLAKLRIFPIGELPEIPEIYGYGGGGVGRCTLERARPGSRVFVSCGDFRQRVREPEKVIGVTITRVFLQTVLLRNTIDGVISRKPDPTGEGMKELLMPCPGV
jgi:hypothetical protein